MLNLRIHQKLPLRLQPTQYFKLPKFQYFGLSLISVPQLDNLTQLRQVSKYVQRECRVRRNHGLYHIPSPYHPQRRGSPSCTVCNYSSPREYKHTHTHTRRHPHQSCYVYMIKHATHLAPVNFTL